jgi:hypothetical protein
VDEEALHREFEAAKHQSPVITKAGLTVGSAASCDMVLDSPGSAAKHARLHQCGESAASSLQRAVLFCSLARQLAMLCTCCLA